MWNYTENTFINQHTAYCIVDNNLRKVPKDRRIEFVDIRMLNDVNNVSNEEELRFETTIKRNDLKLKECQFGIVIENIAGETIGITYSKKVFFEDDLAQKKVRIILPYHQLLKGEYRLVCALCSCDYISKITDYDLIHYPISFEVNFVDRQHNISFSYWPQKKGIAYRPAEAEIIQ